MANTGGPVVVVDVDLQNGGDSDKVRATLIALGVRIFAYVETPGGGGHFYVAGHPDIATMHLQGIDILSDGANVFLPGTDRSSTAAVATE